MMQLADNERVASDRMRLLCGEMLYRVNLEVTISHDPIVCEAQTKDGRRVLVQLNHGRWEIVEVVAS